MRNPSINVANKNMKKPVNPGYPAVVLLAMLIVLEGCATKTYGRLGPYTDAEKSAMTCKDTEVEYKQTLDFMNQVGKASQPSGADAVAVMIDLGIANEKEKKEAMASADQRLVQLRELRRSKKCDA